MTPACAALRASSGPQKASASTVTLTTCLPCAKASRQCSTAAIGIAGALDDDVHLRDGGPAPANRRPCGWLPVLHGIVETSRPAFARLSSLRAPDSRAPHREKGRQCRAGARRACAGSAPGTSSRTCRRRSARCAPACRPRRVAASLACRLMASGRLACSSSTAISSALAGAEGLWLASVNPAAILARPCRSCRSASTCRRRPVS